MIYCISRYYKGNKKFQGLVSIGYISLDNLHILIKTMMNLFSVMYNVMQCNNHNISWLCIKKRFAKMKNSFFKIYQLKYQ